MKVGSGGNLREYLEELFGSMFYSWWNCPLKRDTWVGNYSTNSVRSRHFFQGLGGFLWASVVGVGKACVSTHKPF